MGAARCVRIGELMCTLARRAATPLPAPIFGQRDAAGLLTRSPIRAKPVPTLVRAVALLISAITMSRPTIQKEEATRYAKILNEMGSKHDFDPLIAVAMIHYESRWLPGAASDDGEDFGLGQIRARYIGACKNDEDPVNAPSDACKAVKVNLLVGENNLRAMSGIIGANKKMCTEKRGKNKPDFWIAGYQGLSQPERNKWCTPGPTTTRVLDYHKELVAQLLPGPKSPAKNTAVAKAGSKGTTPAKGTPTKAATAAATKPSVATKPATAKAPVKAAPAAPAKPAVAAKTPAKPAPKTAAKPPAKGSKPAAPHANAKPAPSRAR